MIFYRLHFFDKFLQMPAKLTQKCRQKHDKIMNNDKSSILMFASMCPQEEADDEEENVMDLEALKLQTTQTVRAAGNKCLTNYVQIILYFILFSRRFYTFKPLHSAQLPSRFW